MRIDLFLKLLCSIMNESKHNILARPIKDSVHTTFDMQQGITYCLSASNLTAKWYSLHLPM
jgi:hypothetical protein